MSLYVHGIDCYQCMQLYTSSPVHLRSKYCAWFTCYICLTGLVTNYFQISMLHPLCA